MNRIITPIDLTGAVTVSSDVLEDAKVLQVLCTNSAGTSDGTMALYGSLDAVSYTLLNFATADLGTASPIASHTGADKNQITIVDGLIATWRVSSKDYPFLKLVCVGTAGDGTGITGYFSK